MVLTAALLLCGLFGFSNAPAQSAEPTLDYAKFTAGATAQRGLFTIWNKEGKVYIELAASQLDKDFVETVVPGNGLGGNFIVWGNTDHLPAMLVHFHRAGDR